VADPATAGDDYVSRQRVAGWLPPLVAAGVTVTAVNVAENTDQDAYDGAQLILEAEPRPTAILCFSDLMALAAVHAAQDLGLRVPEDVSVIGFDDSPMARRVRPALTTVRQDLTAKGHAAATLLMAAIERSRGGGAPVADQVRIPTELVVRRSTGPAPV
ncbi:MAG TPA: substrate-binding domain-containing protein, partial [Actinotalea sp.]